MSTTRRAQGYIAAVLIVIVAALPLLLIGGLGTRYPFTTFYPAVMIAAVYGGMRAGLLATGLAGFLASFWMEPVGTLMITDPGDILVMLIFLTTCTLFSYVSELMYRAQERAQEAEAQVELAAEREKAMGALRESEEQFRNLAEALPQIIWFSRPDGSAEYFNRRWTEYTGMTLKQSTGEFWANVLHPEDYEPTLADWKRSLETGEPFDIQYRFKRAEDGRYRWFLGRALPIRNREGQIVRWFGTSTYIHDQKRIEEALRKNEEKLRLALDAAQMGTWDWDILTGELLWSDKCMALFSIDPEGALTYDRFLNALYPEDRKRIDIAVREAIEGHRPYEAEMRVLKSDGTLRWVLGKGRAYYDDSGTPTRMSGIGQDITERKRMDNDLLRAKTEWERTFDSVPDMIAIMDREYRLMRVNRAMARRLGTEPENVIGLHCYNILHGSPLPPDFCPHAQLLKDGKEHVVELHDDRLGGDFLLSVTPLLDGKGNILGTVHVARDISERKRMERALEKRLIALTRPLDSPEAIAFEELFNLDEIQELQDKFAKACGVASIITNVDGTPITRPSNFSRLCRDIIRSTEKGRENCHCSDAIIGRQDPDGPIVQPCLSGGLWDAGASISVGGKHIANWLVGQVRNEAQSEPKMQSYAREIGADEDGFIAAFREVPSMSSERFEMVAQALFTLAGELSSMAYQNIQQARFITERELMEEELRTARDELELRVRERTAELEKANAQLEDQAALLDLAHEAILVRDENGTITFWNNGATETYGFTKEEAVGKCIPDLLQTKFSEPLDRIIEKVMKEKAWEGELGHVTATGKEIVVESRWALKADEGGKPLCFLEINRDVTDRKSAEQALRSNMARLELINSELQEFAFVASHDLQEPLRKIQTFCDMLKTRHAASLDQAGAGYLDRAINSATRMRQLLDDLLQYSRVATGPEPFKEVELGKIMKESADIFEQQIKETGGRIEIANLPKVEVDESQMIHLFRNLIDNALKFRGDKSPVIEVFAVCDGGVCDIAVKDNGIGFEQQYAERIFKPFQRLHGRSEYDGTGMGLAICRKIAERHGGSIRAEGKPGEGATFIVRLPVRQET